MNAIIKQHNNTFSRMSKSTGKRKKSEVDEAVIGLRVEYMAIDNWESKKFSRGQGEDKVSYDVQYVPVPERPPGVPLWKLGWYKDLYGQCDDVSKYGFFLRAMPKMARNTTL